MLKIDVQKSVARVTLDRPDVHNAFNEELIHLITQTFADLGRRNDVRIIVLAASGKSFCAGADLNWMKQVARYTHEQNLEDARHAARMFFSVAKCPKPVIARIHGAALGGGSGLVAACDIGLALESAQFGFTEVKVGIIPAVISPFVIARIGPGRARELFITGERFSARTALNLGLIQQIATDEAMLDALVETKIQEILTSSPGAIAAVKELILGVASRALEDTLDFTAEAIARARVSDEGQAGLKAFLAREKPPWIVK
jgi:methylglutaconyl-CoA hydratase